MVSISWVSFTGLLLASRGVRSEFKELFAVEDEIVAIQVDLFIIFGSRDDTWHPWRVACMHTHLSMYA
jgi:hypothetical protein